MADGILGLGTSGSTDLSSELITKLKTAESTSVLDPITADQEDNQSEIDALDEPVVAEPQSIVEDTILLQEEQRETII